MGESRSRWILHGSLVLIVMLQAVIPQRGFAQNRELGIGGSPRPAGRWESENPRESSLAWRAEVLPGLRFGPPLKASVAVGVAYGNRMGASAFAGPLALGDVGLGGARASVGWLFAGPFASGIELLGSAMRTWGSPAQLERNRTLAGGELRASFFLVNVGGGVFRPVAGFGDDRRTRYYLNLGLGI